MTDTDDVSYYIINFLGSTKCRLGCELKGITEVGKGRTSGKLLATLARGTFDSALSLPLTTSFPPPTLPTTRLTEVTVTSNWPIKAFSTTHLSRAGKSVLEHSRVFHLCTIWSLWSLPKCLRSNLLRAHSLHIGHAKTGSQIDVDLKTEPAQLSSPGNFGSYWGAAHCCCSDHFISCYKKMKRTSHLIINYCRQKNSAYFNKCSSLWCTPPVETSLSMCGWKGFEFPNCNGKAKKVVVQLICIISQEKTRGRGTTIRPQSAPRPACVAHLRSSAPYTFLPQPMKEPFCLNFKSQMDRL